MNPPKCNDLDCIDFLIAAQKAYSCTEAARCQPDSPDAPAHDSLTRLLRRVDPGSDDLWREASPMVSLPEGFLILDDTTLDKPYSKKMDLVTRHRSGKHDRVVKGINLTTLLRGDGDSHVPCDSGIYDKGNDGKSKNDHFRDMLETARERGFRPECALFDGWYASLENLKLTGSFGRTWLTRLKPNRLVNPRGKGNLPVSEAPVSENGTVVHLRGFGFVRVFRMVSRNGDVGYRATNDLEMDGLARLKLADAARKIENHHRGLKQFCGVEKAQAGAATAQRNHMGFAIRAFLRFEANSQRKGIGWFDSKLSITRETVRRYLANPHLVLQPAT